MTSAAATNSAIASPTRYTNAVVEFQRAEAADAAAAVFPDLLVDGAIDSSTTTTAAAAAKQAPSITALPSTLVADPPAQESRVLVIYTGGTIGMKRLPPDAGYVPVHNWLGRSLADMARFNDREANGASMLSGGAVPEETIRCYTMPAEGARNGGTTPEPDARQSVTTVRRPALLTPRSLYDRRVRYTILEYDPLLDSAK